MPQTPTPGCSLPTPWTWVSLQGRWSPLGTACLSPFLRQIASFSPTRCFPKHLQSLGNLCILGTRVSPGDAGGCLAGGHLLGVWVGRLRIPPASSVDGGRHRGEVPGGGPAGEGTECPLWINHGRPRQAESARGHEVPVGDELKVGPCRPPQTVCTGSLMPASSPMPWTLQPPLPQGGPAPGGGRAEPGVSLVTSEHRPQRRGGHPRSSRG